jgi:8-amino-7-oxononanoate synthase
MTELKRILSELKDASLFREIKDIEKIEGKYIYIGGKKYLDFSSSNYLGLRDEERVKEAVKRAVDKYGVGSGASRLVVGTCDIYNRLEAQMSELKKQEKTLFFNSGYDANLGTISTLYGKEDIIFCDKLNHASIYDGIFLSGAFMVRYKHNDMEDLEKKIQKYRSKYKRALIVTDTIFSMDGDKALLCDLVKLKKKYGIELMIDEAHGGGVLGEHGGGLAEEMELLEEIDINMGTFSKAYGGQGAYVSSSADRIDYLINRCRSFIYTTALPPSVVAGNLESVQISIKEVKRRKNIKELGNYLRENLRKIGYNTGLSTSQIIPVILGSNEEALEFSRIFMENGILIPAIRKPTVVEPRIRISLGALITMSDIDILLEIFKKHTKI